LEHERAVSANAAKASKTAVLWAGDDMRLGAAAHMIAPTAWQPERLTRRWSERRTAARSTFEMTSTLSLRATRALVRRRSSCSR